MRVCGEMLTFALCDSTTTAALVGNDDSGLSEPKYKIKPNNSQGVGDMMGERLVFAVIHRQPWRHCNAFTIIVLITETTTTHVAWAENEERLTQQQQNSAVAVAVD